MGEATAKERAFYQGILAAMAVVNLYDNAVLLTEIAATVDEEMLRRIAAEDDATEWAGLHKVPRRRRRARRLAEPRAGR